MNVGGFSDRMVGVGFDSFSIGGAASPLVEQVGRMLGVPLLIGLVVVVAFFVIRFFSGRS